MNQEPYVEVRLIQYHYNKDYGDTRVCECGHSYVRHFDPYESMENVGCKYCACDHFKETVTSMILEEQDYDPGLLNNYGGGNVAWWHDYLRNVVHDCNTYWRELIDSYTEK